MSSVRAHVQLIAQLECIRNILFCCTPADIHVDPHIPVDIGAHYV